MALPGLCAAVPFFSCTLAVLLLPAGGMWLWRGDCALTAPIADTFKTFSLWSFANCNGKPVCKSLAIQCGKFIKSLSAAALIYTASEQITIKNNMKTTITNIYLHIMRAPWTSIAIAIVPSGWEGRSSGLHL